MTTAAPGALAVYLHPVSPTRWVATYYPMVVTPAGRWTEVTWDLHQRLMPSVSVPPGPARWLQVCSPDPAHPCYAGHPEWAIQLAAGYTAAWAVHDLETIEETLSAQEAQQMRQGAFVVPAGQPSEWVLDDLQDETSGLHG